MNGFLGKWWAGVELLRGGGGGNRDPLVGSTVSEKAQVTSPRIPSAWSHPGFVYKGLGGFGILRHPPTQDQATHPGPPPLLYTFEGGFEALSQG